MVAIASASIAGCSAPKDATAAPVNVRLTDFDIESSTPTVASPNVEFDVRNAAPATHEFVVVRSNLRPAALPLAADGLSVDEDALDVAGEISEVPARTTGTVELHLRPGRYVFFCNLDGHYLGGMYGSVRVTSPRAA